MPYTPVGVFLIDQWRQIGLTVQHEQLETRLYLAAQQRGNATYDAALDFNCDFMDEPNLQLQKYLSADRSALNYSGHTDRKLDELYDKQAGELDRAKRTRSCASSSARARSGVRHPDDLVAPHHRLPQAVEGLEHHAQPLRGAGPDRRLAGSVADRGMMTRRGGDRPEHARASPLARS